MENKKIALQSNKPSLGRTPVSSRKPYLTLSDDELANVSGGTGDPNKTYTFTVGDAYMKSGYVYVIRESISITGDKSIFVDRYTCNDLGQPIGSGEIKEKNVGTLAGYESVPRINNYIPLI